jgi:hypothetical protein
MMARLGAIPTTCSPCRCESPVEDRTGFVHLNNDGTYRVRLCQRCGGAYDSVRDAEPLPADAPLDMWPCRRCGAGNLSGLVDRCTNCPATAEDWRCREPACATYSPPDQPRCVRCGTSRSPLMLLGGD